jgi:Ca2+-binding RTX toxin-like protein
VAGIGGRIIVHGLAGADRITMSARVTTGADLYGEDGNDRLTGGGGPDLLVGEMGNDVLTGNGGADMLLGGDGIDRLTSGDGDDLLVGGPTDFDLDPTGLADIVREWTSGSSHQDRVDRLRGVVPGGLNGPTVLTAATMQNDFDRDVLTGGKGADWYIVSANDVASGLTVEDTVTTI